MQVKAESIDRKLILHLRGELDHHAAKQLMQHIARELEYALPLETELDFSGVTFMDSSGIAVALHTMQQMKQLGGKMRIGNPSAQVKKVFHPWLPRQHRAHRYEAAHPRGECDGNHC